MKAPRKENLSPGKEGRQVRLQFIKADLADTAFIHFVDGIA